MQNFRIYFKLISTYNKNSKTLNRPIGARPPIARGYSKLIGVTLVNILYLK